MHDKLPDDELMENNINNDVNRREEHVVNFSGTRGWQKDIGWLVITLPIYNENKNWYNIIIIVVYLSLIL